MEQTKLRLGILGFGEAGLRFAKDLAQAGIADIVVYSRTGAKAPAGDPIHERAREAGVQLVKSPKELAKRYSGHSGRVGFIVAAKEHGAADTSIAMVTRHRSMEMVRRYGERAEMHRIAPHRIKGVGL